MPSRRGERKDEVCAAVEQLELKLGRGDTTLGRRRLELWRELFLPDVPSPVRRPIPVWTPDPAGGGRWSRRSRRSDLDELVAQHFAGEIALGGVYCGRSRVLVLDLDNAAGKNARVGSSRVRLDEDLDARRRLAALYAPRGLWVQSSASRGLHRFVFLTEEVAIDRLSALAHARLRSLAATDLLSPDQRDEIASRARGGIRGFELLPRTAGDSQGDTIRAPLGPGSIVLTETGYPLEDQTEALEYIERLLSRGGRVAPEQLFSGLVTAQLTLAAPATPPTHKLTLTSLSRQALGFESRIRGLAARCDGRLPDEERALPAEVREVAGYLRTNGPSPGTRHYSTCILIYDSILDGCTIDETRARLASWVKDVAPRGSRDARDRLDEALADTERLIVFYYRPRQRKPPRDPKPKGRPPARLRRKDLVHLRARLNEEGGRAVGLAGRILEHVKANGAKVVGAEDYYCELPVTRLGILSQAARRTRNQLRRRGILRLVRPAIPKLDEDHPLGPRAAKPALWRVSWMFAETGPVLPPVDVLFPRRQKGQAPAAQGDRSGFVSARSGGVGVGQPDRSDPRPVRAVDAVASKELVGGASKLNIEARRPQLRQREQDPKMLIGRGCSSTEGLERGSGGDSAAVCGFGFGAARPARGRGRVRSRRLLLAGRRASVCASGADRGGEVKRPGEGFTKRVSYCCRGPPERSECDCLDERVRVRLMAGGDRLAATLSGGSGMVLPSRDPAEEGRASLIGLIRRPTLSL